MTGSSNLIDARILEITKRSGLTPKSIPKWGDYKNHTNKFFKQIREIPYNQDFLFFVASPHGTGKTTAILCLIRECLEKGLTAYYVTAKRLRDLHAWKYDDQEARDELKEVDNAHILAVDEFGRQGESETGHFENYIGVTLESSGRKIILISNIPFTDKKRFLYSKNLWIMSRLRKAVPIGWEDIDHRGVSFRGVK